MDKFEEIKARNNAAFNGVSGEWVIDIDRQGDCWIREYNPADPKDPDTELIGYTVKKEDAEFIVNAKSDQNQLIKIIEDFKRAWDMGPEFYNYDEWLNEIHKALRKHGLVKNPIYL